MMTIIEDTISRNREFKKYRQNRVNSLKKVGAPSELIEYEEYIAQMTVAEYEIYCKEQENLHKQKIAEYAKHNPLKKEIVDEIYNRTESLEYSEIIFWSKVRFLYALDPLNFMSQEDFDNELYESFLDHAREIYCKKFEYLYNEDVRKHDEGVLK